MTRVLILDDDDNRHAGFSRILSSATRTHAHAAHQAIEALSGEPYYLVCLDHDLGPPENGNGMDVANFIAASMAPAQRPRRALIHSHNFPAASRMAEALCAAGVEATIRPYEFTGGE